MKLHHIFIAVLGISLMAPAPAAAQDMQSPNRVSIGFGGGTIPDLIDIFSSVLTNMVPGTYRTDTSTSPAAISVEYNRFLSPRFSVLGSGGVQRISRDVYRDGVRSGKMSSTYTHLMGGAAVHYRRGTYLDLYSNLAGGLAINHDSANVTGSEPRSETRPLPAFQATLLGIRAGAPVGAFLEIGAGYRGMVVFGVSYDF